ncbi:MAG TPA: hypothetical protein DCZ95_07735 [Verrucomicrobia bacterium]|nr:MAG: hypothetical protein A2X46_01080 [Lentisphaerae bacterium GWF2_57_35]HBA83966.1 hypothetical protein [Verrucomicrobiota bacterium]
MNPIEILRRSRSAPHARQGGALVICLLLLGLLSFFAGSVYRLTVPEVASSIYQRNERMAFYNAEAGVQYIISQLSAGLKTGALKLTSAVERVNYTAPEGYQFDPVYTLTRLPNNKWMTFVVTGRFEKAAAVIQATVSRPRLLTDAGIFGNISLTVQPNNEIFSYNSNDTPAPLETDSTHEANIGSNELLSMLNNIFLDGICLLGESLFGVEPLPPSGYPSEDVDRIEPDPLGARNGPLGSLFNYYNNPVRNNNAAAGIANNAINLHNHDVMTLPGGVYYLTSLDLGSGSTLKIGGTPDNPTVIFLHGPMTSQPNSDINVTNGLPTNFLIYSDASDEIRIQPNNDFRGLIYAPYASLRFQPGGSLYGVFWGNTAILLPNNDIFIDLALLDDFLSTNVRLEQWKQLIE